LHWCEGNFLAARRWAQKALAILRSLNARWDVGYALIVLAGIARDCGEPASGHQLASEALRILRSMGDHRGAVIALGILGDVSAARCDDSAALPLYRETFPILVELGDRVSFLSRLLETARAMAGHQPEQAARLLAAHTTLLCTGGFSITDREHAGGQRCLARVRAQLGEAGFTKAWAAGRVLGWEGAVRCAMETLDGTPAAARRHPDESPRRPEPLLKQDHPDGLTSRELEVLRLVASGLTDAQVAGQLVISPRTVNTHLTSIYNKISVSSRAAATRYALQHELI
jgi:DNA-binding CsgD family transcriptional regulator